ncbi:MAG: ABC transporter permease [Rubrivivax sp.]|nr:ABC transporter permease [Rubrivivax sp.]
MTRLPGLAWRWLWSRPLTAALNLLMLSLGFAAVVLLALVSEQIEAQAQRDLAGIDLVVGAKGSPIQLILAGVFHIDVPPGNIPLQARDALAEHPLVEQVIPISLGDSHLGYRIVGTEASLLALYGAQIGSGRGWAQPLEAVLGARVARASGLAEGAVFAGSHGLGGGGELHGDHPYRVVGVLAPCGCVLDRLILTSKESVWAVHEGSTALDEADRQALQAEREVTLLLVRYRSPLAAVTLPRWVQAQAGLQAAVPALESARLFRLLGVGLDVLRALAGLLLAVATLSVFVALTHAVREREADLAMLRMLGAPPRRVAGVLALEAGWLALLGLALGLLLGHGLTHVVGLLLQAERSLVITGVWWSAWHPALPLLALALAAAAVAWPLGRVLRMDVTRLLQSPP